MTAFVDEPRNTGPIRAALVGGDPAFRRLLTEQLAKDGFTVRGFAGNSALLAALKDTRDVDIVLLDCRLPDAPSLALTSELSDRHIDIPVVVLADAATTRQEARAFDLGAADFVFKAQGVGVLARRLKRLVRTGLSSGQFRRDAHLVCGKLELRLMAERVYWDGMDVDLTTGEFAIVRRLVENAGHAVSYRSIYDCLRFEGFIAGKGTLGYRANVQVAIARIRGKFRKLDRKFDEILNDRTVGYAWRLR